MTREEALEKIKKSMECHDKKVCGLAETCEECPLYVDKDTEYEAHKVLISTLSDDAVSRERALEPYKDLNNDDVISVWMIKKNINELPSVTQKPIECDDAISREDALKLIYDFKEKHTEDREKHPINYGTLLDLIRLIRELPSVTQKSGKWIHFAQSDDCSLCGYSTGKYGSPSKYCPNCGAKMESEEQTE